MSQYREPMESIERHKPREFERRVKVRYLKSFERVVKVSGVLSPETVKRLRVMGVRVTLESG